MPMSSSSAASVSLSRLVARKEGLCVGIGISICFAKSKKNSQYCCEMVAHSTMCSWVSSATLHALQCVCPGMRAPVYRLRCVSFSHVFSSRFVVKKVEDDLHRLFHFLKRRPLKRFCHAIWQVGGASLILPDFFVILLMFISPNLHFVLCIIQPSSKGV